MEPEFREESSQHLDHTRLSVCDREAYPSEAGATYDELINKLLALPLSKSSMTFTATFLCLYRKFSSPIKLLHCIIYRFDEMSERAGLIELTSQLRYLTILLTWISDYPGDFSCLPMRSCLQDFINRLSLNPDFALACSVLEPYLQCVFEDEDLDWAPTQVVESDLTSLVSVKGLDLPCTEVKSINIDVQRTGIARLTHGTFSQYELARRQSTMFQLSPKYRLDKAQWRQIISIPDVRIAEGLTNMDWILFASLRPRDLVRHMSLSTNKKANCTSLECVSRIIEQFNHVAFWVANLVLFRDKPKHRALMLTKLMKVAWQLRYLNNYNSLGAVIAGLNGTAVYRLAQTRELVPPEIRKQFMRLEILMGTSKSHSAYRLGWQNTSSARIPFLPLHRRDLVFADEGGQNIIHRHDVEFINWKKFEVMGDIIHGIRESQSLPYVSLKREEQVERLLLDGHIVKDEDALFKRSTQLENARVGENARRKYHLFQR